MVLPIYEAFTVWDLNDTNKVQRILFLLSVFSCLYFMKINPCVYIKLNGRKQ